MRMPGARGYVPINGTDIVSDIVLPHFIEFDALALEYAVVLAGKYVGDQTRRGNLDMPDFFKEIFRNH